eukprot:1915428-Pyramimonas_sp.AAC.1
MRGNSPAVTPAAPTTAASPAVAAVAPEMLDPAGGPPAVFMGSETVLERQQRVYPRAADVEVFTGMEDACAVCLEEFQPRESVYRL